MRAVAIVRTSSSGSSGGRSPSGVPSTRTSRLIGTLSGCGSSDASCCSSPQRTAAVLAHADDAAAADGDAGLAHARERVEPLVVGARRDDAAVELRRRVEVVVVGGQPGVGERVGLLVWSACRACSTPPCRAPRTPRTMSSTRSNCVAVRRHRATPRPCRSASRPARARAWPPPSASSTLDELVRVDAGLVVRRLRAVRAVLRAAAGLDAEQHAALHLVRPVVRAVGLLRAEHQIEERRGVDSPISASDQS